MLRGNCSQLERSELTVLPFLLNTHHNTLPFILFFKWLTVKEDGENTSGKGRRYARLLVRTHIHKHTRMLTRTHKFAGNFSRSQSSITLPTDPHSSLVVSLELSRSHCGYCPSDPNEAVSLPLKKHKNMQEIPFFSSLFPHFFPVFPILSFSQYPFFPGSPPQKQSAGSCPPLRYLSPPFADLGQSSELSFSFCCSPSPS